MKVYVVTTGSHDDFDIVGIFSTMELAEVARVALDYRETGIDEYDLDEKVGWIKGPEFQMWVDKGNGNVVRPDWLSSGFRHPTNLVIRETPADFYVTSPFSYDHAEEAAKLEYDKWKASQDTTK